MKDGTIIVGLDIGTTKITTVIGEVAADGTIDIIGEGTRESEGIKRGHVVNLEQATHAIRQTIESAQRVSGVPVKSVFVSVAGNHTKADTSHGLVAIRRQQEINQADVDRAIENARAIPIDPTLEVLHTLPQEYVVDHQEGIKNPVGMHGVRLEVDVHMVFGSAGPLLNLRRCVQEAGVKVEGFVLQALASGLATLDVAEQANTVVVIDMGGSTTDIGVFKRGNLMHSTCIPIGGEHVTSDLAQILRIPFDEAEKIKRKYGAAMTELVDQEITFDITNNSGETHAVTVFEVARIIKPRVSEIYSLIREEIEVALGPAELMAQSIVLTGGSSQLRGVLELAKDRFRLPVRIGRPRGIGGLSDLVAGPEYASAVGTVLYGIRQDGKLPLSVFETHASPASREPELIRQPVSSPRPQQPAAPVPAPAPSQPVSMPVASSPAPTPAPIPQPVPPVQPVPVPAQPVSVPLSPPPSAPAPSAPVASPTPSVPLAGLQVVTPPPAPASSPPPVPSVATVESSPPTIVMQEGEPKKAKAKKEGEKSIIDRVKGWMDSWF